MGSDTSFQDYATVACGTLNMELSSLKDSGLLDASMIPYTKPGRLSDELKPVEED
jgi:hypothetical protein